MPVFQIFLHIYNHSTDDILCDKNGTQMHSVQQLTLLFIMGSSPSSTIWSYLILFKGCIALHSTDATWFICLLPNVHFGCFHLFIIIIVYEVSLNIHLFTLVQVFKRKMCRSRIAKSSLSIFKYLLEVAKLHPMGRKVLKLWLNMHI